MTKKKPKRTAAPTDEQLLARRQRAAFVRMADAVGVYLETLGWTALVAGAPRIQQQFGQRAANFEFVLEFTGGKRE